MSIHKSGNGRYQYKPITYIWFMVFNATFIYRGSQFYWTVEETRVPGENHRPVASHWQTSSHNVVSSTPARVGLWDSNSQR